MNHLRASGQDCDHVTLVNALYSSLFCCGSLLPVFGVKVSVTFNLTSVHIIFSSVCVAEWLPFGK